MLASSFFDDDPFFRGHVSAMQSHMDQMMGSMMQPFGLLPPTMQRQQYALTQGGEDGQVAQGHPASRRLVQHPASYGAHQAVMRAGHADPFQSMFSNMHSMMNSMMGGMSAFPAQRMAMSGDLNNGQFFSSSSVMSYSNTGNGPPRIYQASSSTRQAPGGIRETRRSVRDSESGIQKMAVGRHINERGHIMTREQNVRTGDREESEELINLDEEEKPAFNDEWRQGTQDLRHVGGGRSEVRHRAIENVRDRDDKQKRGKAEGVGLRKKELAAAASTAGGSSASFKPPQPRPRDGRVKHVRIHRQPKH